MLEIGWWIEPHAWGRGIAAEAAMAVRDDACTQASVASLIATYNSDNVQSRRIMEKLGMSHAGWTAITASGP
ncbi:GNAT family N-acetyltransferase [Nonomuraea polychroma]|uniref:GNAT family N-acetyltransferase n=1 Tax=Nonomuraea polychroma TaxID=46176 RepID=UPI003D9422E9